MIVTDLYDEYKGPHCKIYGTKIVLYKSSPENIINNGRQPLSSYSYHSYWFEKFYLAIAEW